MGEFHYVIYRGDIVICSTEDHGMALMIVSTMTRDEGASHSSGGERIEQVIRELERLYDELPKKCVGYDEGKQAAYDHAIALLRGDKKE